MRQQHPDPTTESQAWLSLPQGDTVSLTCLSSGSPAPSLAWYRDGLLVDATSEQEEEEEEEGLVSNTINLHDVGERETKASFTCRAQNNNQTRPVSRTVRLRLNFPPGDVRIVGLGGESSLLAGKAQSILCVSVGSRPAATITWWKDGKEVPALSLSLTEPLCVVCRSVPGPAD